MSIQPQQPPVQALEYYEHHTDDLGAVVRLVLLAGAVEFLTSAISESLEVERLWGTMTRSVWGSPWPSRDLQYLATMAGQAGASLALAVGCTLCLFRIDARVFACLAAVISLGLRLVFAVVMLVQFAGMLKTGSFPPSFSIPIMIAQQIFATIGSFVFPLLLIAVLIRPQVRELLKRSG